MHSFAYILKYMVMNTTPIGLHIREELVQFCNGELRQLVHVGFSRSMAERNRQWSHQRGFLAGLLPQEDDSLTG